MMKNSNYFIEKNPFFSTAPAVVEAYKVTLDNIDDIAKWCNGKVIKLKDNSKCIELIGITQSIFTTCSDNKANYFRKDMNGLPATNVARIISGLNSKLKMYKQTANINNYVIKIVEDTKYLDGRLKGKFFIHEGVYKQNTFANNYYVKDLNDCIIRHKKFKFLDSSLTNGYVLHKGKLIAKKGNHFIDIPDNVSIVLESVSASTSVCTTPEQTPSLLPRIFRRQGEEGYEYYKGYQIDSSNMDALATLYGKYVNEELHCIVMGEGCDGYMGMFFFEIDHSFKGNTAKGPQFTIVNVYDLNKNYTEIVAPKYIDMPEVKCTYISVTEENKKALEIEWETAKSNEVDEVYIVLSKIKNNIEFTPGTVVLDNDRNRIIFDSKKTFNSYFGMDTK